MTVTTNSGQLPLHFGGGVSCRSVVVFVHLLLLGSALIALIYARGIGYFYIDDDLWIAGAAEKHGIWAVLLSHNGVFLRPLEGFVAYLDHSIASFGIAPIAKTIQMGVLLGKMLLTFLIATQLRLRTKVAFFISVLVAIHPINVSTVAQVDTVSQGVSDFSVLLCAWRLRIFCTERKSMRVPYDVAIVLLMIVLAVASKESSFFPIGVVIGYYFFLQSRRFSALEVGVAMLYIGLILSCYAILHSTIGELAPVIPARYQLSFGDHIVKNVLLTFIGLAYIGDSAAIAIRSIQGFVESFLYLVVIGILIFFHTKLRWTKTAWVLIGIGFSTLIPVIFAQAISEHNVTGALPFLLLAVGLSLKSSRWPKAVVVMIAVMCLVASTEKMSKIAVSQEQSRQIFLAFQKAVDHGDKAEVKLCFRKFTGREYSIYAHDPMRSMRNISDYFGIFRGATISVDVMREPICI